METRRVGKYTSTFEEHQKARSDAYNKFMSETYVKLWRLNPDLLDYELDQSIISALKRAQGKSEYKMITINFPRTIDMNDNNLHLSVAKFLKKKWLGRYLYAWEFHTNAGYHPHIHLLTRSNKAPSEMQKETFNTFKKILGNIEHVNIQECVNTKKSFDYILGFKNGEPKPHYDEDVEERKKWHLKQRYGELKPPVDDENEE